MDTQQRIRVLLVDDHAMFREALRGILDREPGIEIVGTAAEGAAALQMLKTVEADVMVLDVSMPGVSGIDVARRLSRDPKSPKLLALTAFEDPAYLRELLSLGVKGYILKHAAAADLVKAIRVVARGETALDPSVANQVVNAFLGRKQSAQDPTDIALTPREREILIEIARGFSQREVAERLGISPKTVETHKANFTQKLGLTSRAELVRYAMERGWLTGKGET